VDDMKDVQEAYHDWEAPTYDDKFGITFDDHVTDYAVGRLVRGLGDVHVAGDALELGCGTGFFGVNLAKAGRLTGSLTLSDLSPRMLEVAAANAAANGVAVRTAVADAESLPFDDDTFDLVLGHAFLHHLPIPGVAIREAHRVLRPGGRLLVAGEPSHWGERITTVVKRATWAVFDRVTSQPRFAHLRRHHDHGDDAGLAALEADVDLHTFHPDEVERMASVVGFTDVVVQTEELTANWWGWAARTVEGSLAPDAITPGWSMGVFRGYRALTRLDEVVLRRIVPRPLFYNLVLAARKPVSPPRE